MPPQLSEEWVTLEDEEGNSFMFEVQFLLSTYDCIYGRGCQGIDGVVGHGCCSLGAYFTDGVDEMRVYDKVRRIIDEGKHGIHGTVSKQLGPNATEIYHMAVTVDYPDLFATVGNQRKTRVRNGVCIFQSEQGCVLHIAALERGEDPMDWKPSICSHMPIHFEIDEEEDGTDTMTVCRHENKDWADGEAQLDWWCVDDERAYQTTTQPLWITYGNVIRREVGDEVFKKLAEYMIGRRTGTATPVTIGRRKGDGFLRHDNGATSTSARDGDTSS